MHRIVGSLAALALFGSAACTHQMNVTPSFSPLVVAASRTGMICPHGEFIAVSAANEAADANSAGTTEAGIHTFNYRFESDPALTLKSGLEQALAAGGCRVGGVASATLAVTIVNIEARGLSCGFFTCDGEGEALVNATLTSGDGRPLMKNTISAKTEKGCGLTICSEREASEMAEVVLSDTISRTVSAFANAIAKQLSPPPPVPAPGPSPLGSDPQS